MSNTNPENLDLSVDRGFMLRAGAFTCAVCVPKAWDDERVIDFAESNYPCGTTNGWQIAKPGGFFVGDSEVCIQCPDDENRHHLLLDC